MCHAHEGPTLLTSDFEDLVCLTYIAQNHLWFGESVGLLWLGLEWQTPHVISPKICNMDEVDKFSPKEVVENIRNEDDLRNMLWPIQWIQWILLGTINKEKGWLSPAWLLGPQDWPACRIGDKEKLFPWHLFKGPLRRSHERENLYFRKEKNWPCGGSIKP